MNFKFQAPKGVPEYLPPESAEFINTRNRLLSLIRCAGYNDIELPIFESTTLFVNGIGESTDAVSKEMYTFLDKGKRSITLRPEGTAGIVRSIIQNSLNKGLLPIKLCYSGPFFRYERPQSGRYRQLQQVGIEAIGINDPLIDAEVITLANSSFRSLGLNNFRLEINSLGDETCRPIYRNLLKEFLLKIDLNKEVLRRVAINPLRVLDEKKPSIRILLSKVPLMIDYLSDNSNIHFEILQIYLNTAKVPYFINPLMVRGLDYYTKTTFEFIHFGLGAQSSIGGGGRYDELLKRLGGQNMSGIGFGIGIDRTLIALRNEKKSVARINKTKVLFVPVGGKAKIELSKIVNLLRNQGVKVDIIYDNRGIKSSIKVALRSKIKYAVSAEDIDIELGIVKLNYLPTGKQLNISISSVGKKMKELIDS